MPRSASNGVHEKLVANWLDNASERSLQPVFCQMLVAHGHKLLHSTRHTPIELGADVVSLDADGIPCAFQLKGHPGGRLTSGGFRKLIPQIDELTHYSLSYPECRGANHMSYLVTNGELDEDARLAVERYNQRQLDLGTPERRLEVWTRGHLLNMALDLEAGLWPSELDDTRRLLGLMRLDGEGAIRDSDLSLLLTDLLGLKGDETPSWSGAALERRIASAALVTSICLLPFQAKNNHAAIVEGWILLAVMIIGAFERHQDASGAAGRQTLALARDAAVNALADLAKEATEREHLLEGEALVDGEFIEGRVTRILGLLSLLWLQCEEACFWPQSPRKEDVEDFLDRYVRTSTLWGEAAVPSYLLLYWAQRRRHAGIRTDALLVQLLEAVTRLDEKNDPVGLPGPYWTYEDVKRHQLRLFLGPGQPMDEFGLTSQATSFGEVLLQLLARTKLKEHCRALWPAVSRFLHASFEPRERWQYCLPRSPEGLNRRENQDPTRIWDDLVDIARHVDCPHVPELLINDPFLLSAWIEQQPQRAMPEVVRRLGYHWNRVWLIPSPKGLET